MSEERKKYLEAQQEERAKYREEDEEPVVSEEPETREELEAALKNLNQTTKLVELSGDPDLYNSHLQEIAKYSKKLSLLDEESHGEKDLEISTKSDKYPEEALKNFAASAREHGVNYNPEDVFWMENDRAKATADGPTFQFTSKDPSKTSGVEYLGYNGSNLFIDQSNGYEVQLTKSGVVTVKKKGEPNESATLYHPKWHDLPFEERKGLKPFNNLHDAEKLLREGKIDPDLASMLASSRDISDAHALIHGIAKRLTGLETRSEEHTSELQSH